MENLPKENEQLCQSENEQSCQPETVDENQEDTYSYYLESIYNKHMAVFKELVASREALVASQEELVSSQQEYNDLLREFNEQAREMLNLRKLLIDVQTENQTFLNKIEELCKMPSPSTSDDDPVVSELKDELVVKDLKIAGQDELLEKAQAKICSLEKEIQALREERASDPPVPELMRELEALRKMSVNGKSLEKTYSRATKLEELFQKKFVGSTYSFDFMAAERKFTKRLADLDEKEREFNTKHADLLLQLTKCKTENSNLRKWIKGCREEKRLSEQRVKKAQMLTQYAEEKMKAVTQKESDLRSLEKDVNSWKAECPVDLELFRELLPQYIYARDNETRVLKKYEEIKKREEVIEKKKKQIADVNLENEYLKLRQRKERLSEAYEKIKREENWLRQEECKMKKQEEKMFDYNVRVQSKLYAEIEKNERILFIIRSLNQLNPLYEKVTEELVASIRSEKIRRIVSSFLKGKSAYEIAQAEEKSATSVRRIFLLSVNALRKA